MSFDTIETARLILRQWRERDRATFAAMNADPRVMAFFPSMLTRTESNAMVDRITHHFREFGYGLWALEVKNGPRFVGYVGLKRVDFEATFVPAMEIGWRLAHEAWGHGYASEAARAVLAFAFNQVGLDEIVSFTAEHNARSRAVMTRIGMRHHPEEDFDHPRLAPDSPLLRHVLYRITGPGR